MPLKVNWRPGGLVNVKGQGREDYAAELAVQAIRIFGQGPTPLAGTIRPLGQAEWLMQGARWTFTGGGTKVVVFPKPFPRALIAVVVSGDDANMLGPLFGADAPTLSQFSITISGNPGTTRTGCYLALGY